jgi:hypothetical protein
MAKSELDGLIGDPQRAPLPAGDPQCWDLLVDGTILTGLCWPGWGSVERSAVQAWPTVQA